MKQIFNLYSLILLAIFLLSYFLVDVSNSWKIISLFIFFIQLILFFNVAQNSNGDLKSIIFRPFYILIFSSLIVNLQSVLNVLLEYGKFSDYNKGMIFLNPYMDRCLYIGLIEIILLTIGYTNSTNYNRKGIVIKYRKIYNEKYIKSLKGIFLILFILSFIGFISTIDIIAFITGTDYQNSGSANREFKNYDYYETLLTLFMYIYVAIESIDNRKNNITLSQYIRNLNIPFICVFLSYIVLRLFSGDRGPVMYSMLLIFFAYIFVSKRRLKLKTIISLGAIGIFCISLLGTIRQQSSTLSFLDKVQSSYKSIDKNNKRKSISPFTQELAGSIDCTALAIRGIDIQSLNYGNGKYSFYTLFSSVPGCNSIMRTIDPDFNIRNYQTAEVITKEWAGDNYPFGLGMTPIADIYLDFGIIGVLLIFPIFGMIFKKVDSFLYINYTTNNPLMLIFTLYISSYAVYIPRSSFLFVFSKASYAIIIFIIISFFWKYCKSTINRLQKLIYRGHKYKLI